MTDATHTMTTANMQRLIYVLALALISCGGGSNGPTSFAQLSAAASQVETSAAALGNDTACHVDADCSALVFNGVCGDRYAPLSLLSPNADRAVSLASEQRLLMQEAMSAPDFIPPPCAAPTPYDHPTAVCAQTQCTLRYTQPNGG